MKQVPLTSIFNGIFWLNIVALLVILLVVIFMPSADFSESGITLKGFWGFAMGAFFSCPWLPPRPWGTPRPPMGQIETYVRIGGVIAGCIQTFH